MARNWIFLPQSLSLVVPECTCVNGFYEIVENIFPEHFVQNDIFDNLTFKISNPLLRPVTGKVKVLVHSSDSQNSTDIETCQF